MQKSVVAATPFLQSAIGGTSSIGRHRSNRPSRFPEWVMNVDPNTQARLVKRRRRNAPSPGAATIVQSASWSSCKFGRDHRPSGNRSVS